MSRSSSSQSQAQTFTDNRRVLGEGAVHAGGNVNQTSYVVDNGTVERSFTLGGKALDTVDKVAAKAFSFGSDALGFGESALNSNNKVVAQAFDYGADAQAGALSLVSKSLSQLLNFGADSQSEALAATKAATTQSFNMANDSMAMVADAYAEAKGRGAMTDKLLLAALVGMGFIAYAATKK